MRPRVIAVVVVIAAAIIAPVWLGGSRWRASRDRAKVEAALDLAGLRFTPTQRDLLSPGLGKQREAFEKVRTVPLANEVAPALYFRPWPTGFQFPSGPSSISLRDRPAPALPRNLDDLGFASVADLSSLVKARLVTSEALVRLTLARLRGADPKLLAVVTYLDQRALASARRADAEIAAGRWRGPLHGLPYGAKDLLAAKGAPTTWGSRAFEKQVFDRDAAAIERLEAAGAVLVAKLSLGELAWGDVWFGGQTKNPWKTSRGSSGSSAGPAATVAAGLLPFALGSETLGSILSPSAECGVTGLRPTFGRVGRGGAMALAWSLDKIGPLCRSAEDCALVLEALRGSDPRDPTAVDAPFRYAHRKDLRGVRLGVVQAFFDREHEGKANDLAALDALRKLGAEIVPFELPTLPIGELRFMLEAEAAAAFDELTRSGRDALLVRQIENAWPNVFRRARLLPAVEYIQANRVRTLLIEDLARRLGGIDALVAPTRTSEILTLTNWTGHPAVGVPDGFTAEGVPTSLTFVGHLLREGELLSIAQAWQDATGHHLRHPPP